jgi:hypothetical protein
MNYVKINANVAGQKVKLFIRESDTYKVLKGLTLQHGNKEYSVSSLSVDMRKVSIPDRKRGLIKPLVEKSMAWILANG